MTNPLSEEALSRGENMMFDCPPSASDEASSGKQGPTSQQAAMVEASAESALNALDQIADQWAVEIDLLSCVAGVALSPMLADSVEAFSRQCFIEGAYRGFLAGREFSPSENSVSDEQPMAEDPKGLSAKHASAMTEGQTPNPNPLPADHAEIVKELQQFNENSEFGKPHLLRAATLIASQAEEIESYRRDNVDKARAWDMLAEKNARIRALQSDIERITKERDEANGYRHQLHEALRLSNENLASMTAALKEIDRINDNPARFNSEINDVIARALSQTKGTDDA